MSRFVFVLALVLSRLAWAAPPRVVLADGDPELLRAVETSLRPWHFVIVVDPDMPPSDAKHRAEQDGARFVVWRAGDQLVVFDHDTGLVEQRPAHAGALDPTGAAAAALTIKTMMRLPPPSDEMFAVAAPGPELRVEAGTGVHYEASDAELRGALAATLRPWHDLGWWFGVIGDVGTSDAIAQAGFKGTWQTWDVLLTARYAIDLGHSLWLEPHVAAGIEHSSFEGTEQMGVQRDEPAILLGLRGGAIARYRLGRWSFAAAIDVIGRPFTQTYTMSRSSSEIFEIPALGLGAGVLVGADLGL